MMRVLSNGDSTFERGRGWRSGPGRRRRWRRHARGSCRCCLLWLVWAASLGFDRELVRTCADEMHVPGSVSGRDDGHRAVMDRIERVTAGQPSPQMPEGGRVELDLMRAEAAQGNRGARPS